MFEREKKVETSQGEAVYDLPEPEVKKSSGLLAYIRQQFLKETSTLFSEGRRCFENGWYKGAQIAYKKSLENYSIIDPSSYDPITIPILHARIAECCVELNAVEEGLKSYETALEKFSEIPGIVAHNQKRICHEKLGKLHEESTNKLESALFHTEEALRISLLLFDNRGNANIAAAYRNLALVWKKIASRSEYAAAQVKKDGRDSYVCALKLACVHFDRATLYYSKALHQYSLLQPKRDTTESYAKKTYMNIIGKKLTELEECRSKIENLLMGTENQKKRRKKNKKAKMANSMLETSAKALKTQSVFASSTSSLNSAENLNKLISDLSLGKPVKENMLRRGMR